MPPFRASRLLALLALKSLGCRLSPIQSTNVSRNQLRLVVDQPKLAAVRLDQTHHDTNRRGPDERR